jgi:drug/metabolite transporter (DMT)-like permease
MIRRPRSARKPRGRNRPEPAMTPPSPQRKALVVLVLLTAIWSYNWIVMKSVLRYTGPFEFAALRTVLGTAVLFALLLARRESLRPPPLLPTIAIGLAQTTAFQGLVQWALVEGGAGRTALLVYTMPFWVVPLAWFGYGERPTARQLVSVGAAFAGMVLVLEPWHGFGNARSAVLATLGGIAWACGVVVSKRVFLHGGVGALSLAAWQMLAGMVGLVVITLVVDERPIEWSGYFVGALAYNAVLASGLAWAMWTYIVERLPGSVAGLSSLAIPVAGVGLAWLELGEVPSRYEAIGLVVIAVALAALLLRRRPAS